MSTEIGHGDAEYVVEPLESAMTWPMFVRSYVYERK
jgi:hypothetical protein